ncbi:hypothetical protein F5884DRAFT_83694 [Xylogone sp. PMI_703]|nr:hypothetical protein F5884DRAFT_83694 [Xylogone sp. PMI_703]
MVAFGHRAQFLDRLDVGILNAGNFKFEWATSSTTGNESQLQVNHLSSTLLSLLLVPVLCKTRVQVNHRPDSHSLRPKSACGLRSRSRRQRRPLRS